MQISSMLLFLSLCISGNQINLNEIAYISSPGARSLDYVFFSSKEADPPHMIIFEDSIHKTIIECFSTLDENTPRFCVAGDGFSRKNCFSYENTLYFYLGQLYVLDFNSFKLDSIDIPKEEYVSFQLYHLSSETLLLANSKLYIDIYSFPDFKLKTRVTRDEKRQFDMPVLADDYLVYQSEGNRISFYNMRTFEDDTSFSTQSQPAYFLGFKIGDFDDIISGYRVAQCESKWNLYFTSFSGSVHCIDVGKRQVVSQTNRFRGTINNAGLITFFELVDVNLDSIPDIIGASVDHHVYAIDGKDLSILWHTDTGNENQMPASLFDINGDRIPEIFLVNDAMDLFILCGSDGKVLLKKNISKNRYQTGVSLVDYNGDGQLNLICNSDAKSLKIFNLDPIHILRNKIFWQSFL